MLLLSLGFLALRFFHLRADFPNHSFWIQDGAKYTDEGWYANAAINHITFGHWYVSGDWSPAVVMPAWPIMIAGIFHFTGISILAARGFEIAFAWFSTLIAYLIVRQYRSYSFGIAVVFLASCNALGFFFSRLAILEAPMVFFAFMAIYVAGRVKKTSYFLAILVGLLICIGALTKTTALFLLPAILYPIWARNRYRPWVAIRFLMLAFMSAMIPLEIEHHWMLQKHAADSAAFFGPMHPLNLIAHSLPKLLRFLFRATWIDPVLYPISLIAFLFSIFRFRYLWRDDLFATMMLWEIGYAAFIVFHLDGPPRYFVVLIVPTIVIALIFTQAVGQQHRKAGMALCALIAASAMWNMGYMLKFMLRPQFTLFRACNGVRDVIRAHPNWDPLLMGHGADEISLITGGMPAIDTDGAMSFDEKLQTYQPGWYMFWGTDQPTRTAILNRRYIILSTTQFPALDSPGKRTLVLYQISPRPTLRSTIP